jgi:hypothetical protein
MWWMLWACGDPAPPPADPDETGVTSETGEHTGVTTPTWPGACEWLGTTPLRPTADCPVWTLGGSVTLDSLVVEPGTVLELGPGVVVRVLRWLDASGTEARPIVFRSAGQGAWGGLALEYVGDSTYYYDYDSGGPSEQDTRYLLRHVTLEDAGAGREAAITVGGGYETCGNYDCRVVHGTVEAKALVLRGSASAGIVGDGDVLPHDPIGFSDVAGPLLDLPYANLAAVLVEDLGGNTTPVIRVRNDPRENARWEPQGVPLEVVEPLRIGWVQRAYSIDRDHLVIEPNTVRFAADTGISVLGGQVKALGVTFEAATPGVPWTGLATTGDDVGWTDHRRPVRSELELVDCVVRDARSPAVDWALGFVPPTLSGTTIEGVAPAGSDVCVAACGVDYAAVELGNTLDCSVPVSCPP